MFPQPKKYGRYVAVTVFALFAYKNPEAAAELVQQAGATLMQVADQLGKFAAAF